MKRSTDSCRKHFCQECISGKTYYHSFFSALYTKEEKNCHSYVLSHFFPLEASILNDTHYNKCKSRKDLKFEAQDSIAWGYLPITNIFES